MTSDINQESSNKLFFEAGLIDPDLSLIESMVAEGANVNIQSEDDGYTPLMLAVDNDEQELVEKLLRLGANPLIKNNYGETASEIALSLSPIFLILKNYELLFLTAEGDVDGVKSVLAAGADVNYQAESDGYTSLMIAAKKSQLEIVELLLDKGADINLSGHDGNEVFDVLSQDEVFIAIRKRWPLEVKTPQPLQKVKRPCLTIDELFFESDTISESQPGATDEQIADLERYCGHALPEKYKIILKKFNHAILQARRFICMDEEWGILVERNLSDFFSLGDDRDQPANIWWHINYYGDDMGPDSIPIADDGYGQTYFIKWVDGVPQIWCLHSEDGDEAYDDDDDDDEPECYLVMSSFDELLEALYYVEE